MKRFDIDLGCGRQQRPRHPRVSQKSSDGTRAGPTSSGCERRIR